MCTPFSSSKPITRVRLRPEALGCSTSQSPTRRPSGMLGARRDGGGDEVVRRALQQRHLPAGRGAQRLRVTLAPVLVDQRAGAQVADAGAAAAQEACERARLADRAERRRRVVHARTPAARRCAGCRARPCGARADAQSPPWWHALRATSPPIECPTSAICSTSVGQPATSSSSSAASDRPFSEMWRPVLKRTKTGVAPRSRSQPRAVGVAAPGMLGLEQAVQEHDHARAGIRARRRARHGSAVDADAHRLRQLAPLGLERVAAQAVDHREHRRSARRHRQRPAAAGDAPARRVRPASPAAPRRPA